VVLTPRRWRQVGGSNSASDGDKKARSPGRVRRKPLKPLRREGRTASAEPVCSCAFPCFHLHARPRVQRAPGFPCALFSKRAGRKDKTSRENTRRDSEVATQRSRSHARYLPSLHALLRVAGRGRGVGGYQLASLVASLPRHPPPPTPPHRFAGEWTKHSTLFPARRNGLLRGACHRAALCADPLARNDGATRKPPQKVSDITINYSPKPTPKPPVARANGDAVGSSTDRRRCCPKRRRKSAGHLNPSGDYPCQSVLHFSPPPPSARWF
jgi:hypothetical protein